MSTTENYWDKVLKPLLDVGIPRDLAKVFYRLCQACSESSPPVTTSNAADDLTKHVHRAICRSARLPLDTPADTISRLMRYSFLSGCTTRNDTEEAEVQTLRQEFESQTAGPVLPRNVKSKKCPDPIKSGHFPGETVTSPLETHLDEIGASSDFKEITLRVLALSRRKHERMGALVQREFDKNQFDPDVHTWHVWAEQIQPARKGLHVVLGIINRYSALAPEDLDLDIAQRTKILLDRLERAKSATDVTEFPPTAASEDPETGDTTNEPPRDPRDDKDGVCWPDQVGARWEAQGADPGRIFESGEALTPDCLPGVMVLTQDNVEPGQPPRSLVDVKQAVATLRRGLQGAPEEMELVTKGGFRPVLAANWLRIQPTLG